jgi:hypothetical protein
MPAAACLMGRKPIGLQVDEGGAGDVAGLISGSSRLAVLPAEVDHAEARIAQVGGQPG